ncbi:MAG TPA: L-aspartate oxidase [Longimicrobiaceae bacterium]|nr:L-aspartate oxidase [Longimicrobiaceae bacterium]
MTPADVLVVGSGIAGLSFALKAARFGTVQVVTKKERPESSTNYAQGGIAAVFSPDDSYALHVEDTLVAGAGLCHPDAVEALVREGPERVRELIRIGVEFTRRGEDLSLGREGGHSRRRIVRSDDLTGREIERGLLAAVAASPNIRVLEDHAAVDLLVAADPVSGEPRCFGAAVLDPGTGEMVPFLARATLLATGGCGQVYRHTTNPAIATGDGVAMAYRAGARVANMEFIQFHPTALYPARERTLLISEAVRGEGAELRRIDGTPFMRAHHPLGSLAPRDIVARAIDREMKRSGDPYVLLDCSAIPEEEIRARFPNILRETAARGIDMLAEPLPVVPAAHYLCGGVLTDTHGRTSVRGLYAAGETACTGVHGANRLASNSLLEAVVFAHRAAERLRSELPDLALPPSPPDWGPPPGRGEPEGVLLVHDREEIRSTMWDLVGIVRSDERLAFAEARIQQIAEQNGIVWASSAPSAELVELRNMIETALLVVRCARMRRESRGLHYNVDHPYRDNEHFLRDTVLGR